MRILNNTKDSEMLNASMTAKFIKRFEQLAQNPRQQCSESGHSSKSQGGDEVNSQANADLQEAANEPEELINLDQSSPQVVEEEKSASEEEVVSNSQQPEKAIDLQELQRLVDIEREKKKTLSNVQVNFKPAVQKTIQQKQKAELPKHQSTTSIKEEPPRRSIDSKKLCLPKYQSLNNLLKLSEVLSTKQLLMDIKYRAKSIGIVPMRYFLYFSIELLLFKIHKNLEKSNIHNANSEDLVNEIAKVILEFICSYKISERPMVCRIVKALFVRLGLLSYYSETWFNKLMERKSEEIESSGLLISDLLNPTPSLCISSNLFAQVPLMSQEPDYSDQGIGLLEWSDEDEQMDDPEKFQKNPRLFYLKSKPKKSLIASKSVVKKSFFEEDQELKNQTEQPNEEPIPLKPPQNDFVPPPKKSFKLQINLRKKTPVTGLRVYHTTQFFTTLKPPKQELSKGKQLDNKIERLANNKVPNKNINNKVAQKQKQNQKQTERQKQKQPTVQGKRQRPFRQTVEQQLKQIVKAPSFSKKNGLESKQFEKEVKEVRGKSQMSQDEKNKIFELIEYYIFHNAPKIAEVLGKHFKIDEKQVAKIIEEKGLGRPVPQKKILQPKQSQADIQKRQIIQIVTNIEQKALEMERSGKYGQKEIVREILQMVDQQQVPGTVKQACMSNWIKLRQERLKASKS